MSKDNLTGQADPGLPVAPGGGGVTPGRTVSGGSSIIATLGAYVAIARVDHWFKQVFCIPGVVLAVSLDGVAMDTAALIRIAIGLLATSIVASSNYVINEILDAPSDLAHPEKRNRPIPAGLVDVRLAYLEWFALGVVGLALAWCVNFPFFLTAAGLLVMGIIYNVPPVRSKELVVGDVLSESINNPLRLLLGWYSAGAVRVAPLSVLCSYWMLGAFLMAAKRYAEFRHIGDREVAAQYRRSFRHYTENRLVALMVFCVNCFSLFMGIFLIKYRVELILSIPFLAGLVTVYWHTSLKPNSPVQHPEKLYKEKRLMFICALLAVAGIVLLLVDMPFLGACFEVHGQSNGG